MIWEYAFFQIAWLLILWPEKWLHIWLAIVSTMLVELVKFWIEYMRVAKS